MYSEIFMVKYSFYSNNLFAHVGLGTPEAPSSGKNIQYRMPRPRNYWPLT